ncbi:MAG: L-aspartate oxidase [Planctomycetes bacterium]|nr:L-aspartate oxidase [Planctomycetota bacterium]
MTAPSSHATRRCVVRTPALLADYDLRRTPVYFTEVLVIGSGVAGLSAALEAAESRDVALVAKAPLEESNTLWAQGGVAAVLGVDDSLESHRRDTMEVGQGLCEQDVVDEVTGGGRSAIESLSELGVRFDRRPNGSLELLLEGGHSHERVVHAQGDSTGKAIEQALVARVRSHPRIEAYERTHVVDLLLDDAGSCLGALAIGPEGRPLVLGAARTILATGGAGCVYRETTNPPVATGDGVAIAFRAGAAVRDLEFFQFHPTTLYIAGAARLLVSEIVRGKGGILVDRHGHRFMPDYHPDGELAPRDVVSRSIVRQMVKVNDTSAYLDLSRIPGDVRQLFPHVAQVCGFFDIDIAHDRIPVRPAAHYFVGGVEVDAEGRTSIPGLLAVGEVASSGLHGANRIGSNSLLEGLVLGRIVGSHAARDAGGKVTLPRGPLRREETREVSNVRLDVEDVAYSVRSLMGRMVGVERVRPDLDLAIERLDAWARYLFKFRFTSAREFEVANLVTVARLVAESAAFREESRGTHYRTDHPERDDARWRVHTRIVRRGSQALLEAVPLRAPSPIQPPHAPIAP